MKNKILSILLSLIICFSLFGFIVPVTHAEGAELDYYYVTYPVGLRYSPDWCGTLSYVPNNVEIVMYDDTWTKDFGRLILSVPAKSPAPHGVQGGTSIIKLSYEDVNSILGTYSPKSIFEPIEDEILEVMKYDHYFLGAWSGEKLKDKWSYNEFERYITTYETVIDEFTGEEVVKEVLVEKILTDKQLAYLTESESIEFSAIDLEKYDPDRYFVMGQVFFTDGTANCDLDGRQVADSAFTVAGAGNFTIHMASGTSGTITGTNVVGTPVALAAGLNTITTTGAVVDGNFDITIGTAANWNTVNSWSAASGGACAASVPTNADNTLFDANSFTAGSQVLTVDAAANCLSMDWTGATNTPTLAGSNELNIYGSLTTIAAMTWSHSGNLYFRATAGAHTITTNGLSITSYLRVNGNGGTFTLQDAYTTTNLIAHMAGTFDTNGQTVTLTEFNEGYATARTLTLGASTINCTAWTYLGSNLTVTANTATINITGTGACALGSADWNGADFNLNGTAHTVSGSPTGIATFTRNGTATNADSVTFTSGTTLTCTDFALIGNSRANQLLAQSSTLGTAATITATNAPTLTNVDLMDLTFTNAFDASAQDDVGDCGGNTGITFPAGVAQTSAGTNNWSVAAGWSGRVPLPQDDVTCSHSKTVDMPRIGKSITFTGTPTITLSEHIKNYGSFTLSTGCTYTHSDKNNSFSGRDSYTLTTNGKILYTLVLVNPTGTLTLGSDVAITANFYYIAGAFDCGGYDFSAALLTELTPKIRAFNARDATITLTNTTATDKWLMTSANNTFTAGTSTIILTNSSANAQTFAGAGLTYNNVTVQGAGNYALTITGNNTFADFKVDASGAAKTITNAGIQTVDDFTRDLGGTNVITLNGAGTWTKSDAVDINLDYLTVTGMTATPATTWYIGTHSTTGGGDAGFTFDGSPITVTTNAATGISMTAAGVTAATVNGDPTDLAGTPYFSVYYEYGLTGAYGATTAATNQYDYTAFADALPNNLTPGSLYHFRAVVVNGTGTYNGADQTFTFTMPTTQTVASTASTDIHGHTSGEFNYNVTNLGVATSTYISFTYGYTGAMGTNTAQTTVAALGAGTIPIPDGLTPGATLFYSAVSTCGATVTISPTLTLLIPKPPAYAVMFDILPVLIAILVVAAVMSRLDNPSMAVMLGTVVGGILIWVIVNGMLSSL